MNRRNWWQSLLALFGGMAQAQRTGIATAAPESSVKLKGEWKSKPANGQCPVCGTMAAPYKRSDTLKDRQASSACAPATITNGTTFAVCGSWTIDDIPRKKEVTCSHCRVKFEQDAEPEPTK